MSNGIDYFTSYGAGVLASQIEAYWRGLGFAGIHVERYVLPGTEDTYGLRSNIGPDGYPPRSEWAAAEQLAAEGLQ